MDRIRSHDHLLEGKPQGALNSNLAIFNSRPSGSTIICYYVNTNPTDSLKEMTNCDNLSNIFTFYGLKLYQLVKLKYIECKTNTVNVLISNEITVSSPVQLIWWSRFHLYQTLVLSAYHPETRVSCYIFRANHCIPLQPLTCIRVFLWKTTNPIWS